VSFWDDYPKPAKAGTRVVCSYDYVNGRKEQHLRVRRHVDEEGNKGFSQQQYFNKHWHDGKPGGRDYPYMLNHIIDAPPTTPIWACEGEKDADNLSRLGFVATTNAEGAGKWTADHTVWLAGRDTVYVLADNDPVGAAHARSVARQLQPVVAVVKIIEFPDVPPGEDVSYWFEHGGTKEALLARAAEAPKFKDAICASPFILPDPATIPRREFLYPPHYIRGYVSLTLAPGGLGKSALITTEALAIATGRRLLGVAPQSMLRVWYLNLEDPADELDRRFAATAKHYGITRADIGDRLFINSGRTTPFVLATERNRSALIDDEVYRGAVQSIRANNIDILIVDPVVASHRLDENNNTQMDALCRTLTRIAEETEISVMLVHHTRKLGTERSATVDDGRGASALLAGARSARVLSPMSAKEAADAEIEERLRRSYFRADLGKTNLTPPAERAAWFHVESVDLGNESRDLDNGDNVGVVTSFAYPTVEQPRITQFDIQRALEKLKTGGPWRENQQATAWVGIPIAQALGLGPLEGRTKKQVVRLVKEWLAAGILVKVEGLRDGKGNVRLYVEAGAISPPNEVGGENDSV
jgi:hypothetical protein